MRFRKLVRGATALAAATALAGVAAAPAAGQSARTTRCPGTFQVLHDDHVGALALPAGAYAITATGVSCASAASLLGTFLEDYDGHLPTPWRVDARARGFQAGSGGLRLTLRRVGAFPPAPPTPPTPSNPGTCPAPFSVLHADRIGAVRVPRGAYRTTLSTPGLTCQEASQLFAAFLDDVDGDLPDGWSAAALPAPAQGVTFTNADERLSFTERFAGRATGGGGTSPRGSVACGTFRVLHDDHIGSLYVPSGGYAVSTHAADPLTCAQATRLLQRFLAAAALPSPWVLNAETGTFQRGVGSAVGFRIKPLAAGELR